MGHLNHKLPIRKVKSMAPAFFIIKIDLKLKKEHLLISDGSGIIKITMTMVRFNRIFISMKGVGEMDFKNIIT